MLLFTVERFLPRKLIQLFALVERVPLPASDAPIFVKDILMHISMSHVILVSVPSGNSVAILNFCGL